MNFQTRCTTVYLKLQKILASTFTRLPLSLIDCILRFVLVEVGTQLFSSQKHAVGIIYDIQWNNTNHIDYCITYVPFTEWHKCLGECNWSHVMNHPKRLLHFENHLHFHSIWYPNPSAKCAGNLIHGACMFCGDSICEACFSQSKLLMGTVGDVNTLFDKENCTATFFAFPRLEYYPESDYGCFGYLRICVYCEVTRHYNGNPDEIKKVSQAKAKWHDLMIKVQNVKKIK